MAKTLSNNRVTLDPQEKESLGHIKTRSSTETANTKSEIHDTREGPKRLDQERLKTVGLQR